MQQDIIVTRKERQMPNYSTTEKVALIKQGKESEHYEEWLKEKDPIVLHVLASHGYFPDYFISNGRSDVIALTLKAHPKHLSKIINSTKPEHIHAVHETLIDKINATEEELLRHIYVITNKLKEDPYDYGGYSDIDHRAEMRMKIAADKVVPTTIEKTMTREQLYEAKNIAFAAGLTVREIEEWLNEWDEKHRGTYTDEMRERDLWLDQFYDDDQL